MLRAFVLPYAIAVVVMFVALQVAFVGCEHSVVEKPKVASVVVEVEPPKGMELSQTAVRMWGDDWRRMEKACVYVSEIHGELFQVNLKFVHSLDLALAEMKRQLQDQGRTKVFFTQGKGCTDDARNAVRKVCVDSNFDLFHEQGVGGVNLDSDGFVVNWLVIRVGNSK